jgi:hypothetical protein
MIGLVLKFYCMAYEKCIILVQEDRIME